MTTGLNTAGRAAMKAAALAAVLLAGTGVALAAPMPLDIKDASGKQLSGDPELGATVFKKCAVCHSIAAGQNKIGPSLHGVVGRHSGTVPGFNYSAANKGSGIVWTEQELFVYLEHPQAVVKGTKMAFVGLASPDDRANVIAYLKQNSP